MILHLSRKRYHDLSGTVIYKSRMNEVDLIVHVIIKLYIILNALKLGWYVELYEDRIVLTKQSALLTRLDKDTPRLINTLISDDLNRSVKK